jgi:hypothetical protein
MSEISLTSLVVSTSGKDGKNFFETMEREKMPTKHASYPYFL